MSKKSCPSCDSLLENGQDFLGIQYVWYTYNHHKTSNYKWGPSVLTLFFEHYLFLQERFWCKSSNDMEFDGVNPLNHLRLSDAVSTLPPVPHI